MLQVQDVNSLKRSKSTIVRVITRLRDKGHYSGAVFADLTGFSTTNNAVPVLAHALAGKLLGSGRSSELFHRWKTLWIVDCPSLGCRVPVPVHRGSPDNIPGELECIPYTTSGL